MTDLGLKEILHDTLVKASNAISKTSHASTFTTTGRLTPEEFVCAGDLLVHKCGSWSWSGGDPGKGVKYLPADKQFLITCNVTCNNNNHQEVSTQVFEDDWIALCPVEALQYEAEIVGETCHPLVEDDDDGCEIADAETFDNENNVVECTSDNDDALSIEEVQKTRTYDITICYSQYYQVPHVWLFGYDTDGQPLRPEQLLEDISEDHRGQTVTVKTHPHMDIPYASIHPCKHAHVMEKIVQNMKRAGKEPRVDLYIFIFLKFLSAVIPNIEYDNTFDVDISLSPQE